jgi:hypothetical protein
MRMLQNTHRHNVERPELEEVDVSVSMKSLLWTTQAHGVAGLPGD